MASNEKGAPYRVLRSVAATIAVAGCGVAFTPEASAIELTDINTASPFLFEDLLTFNWRILNQVNPAIPVPATPTGNQLNFIRMFTNGNTQNPAGTDAIVWTPDGPQGSHPDTFNVDGFDAGSSPAGQPVGSSSLDYGLEFGRSQGQDVLNSVMTVGDLTGFLQNTFGLGNADPVTPILAFDQNQEGGENIVFPDPPPGDPNDPVLRQRDILLRGQLFLVDPSLLPADGTLDPIAVDLAIASATNAQIREFQFKDDQNNPEPPPNFPVEDPLFSEDDDMWVVLPGIFDPDGPGNLFQPVDNNGAGNAADWGGIVIDDQTGLPLDLLSVFANDGATQVSADWRFVVRLQAALDNNGREEAYILGVLGTDVPPPNIIPEPMTTTLTALGASGLLLATRRRRSA